MALFWSLIDVQQLLLLRQKGRFDRCRLTTSEEEADVVVGDSDISCPPHYTRVSPPPHAVIAAVLIRSNLIISVLRDVSDPRERLVSALFDDLQVTNLNSGCCEIGNLELHGNWWFPFKLIALDTRHAEVSSHEELFTARERLDVPRK